MNRNILGRWISAETVSHTFIISYQVIIANIQYRTTSVQKRAGHLRPSLPPSVRHLYTNHMSHHLDIYIQVIWNCAVHVGNQTKLKVIRMKHNPRQLFVISKEYRCYFRVFSNISVMVSSLAPGRPGCHFKTAIFNLVLLIGIFTSSNDNAMGPHRW